MAKERHPSTAPTRGCWAIPHPRLRRARGTLIRTLTACPRTSLQAEHDHPHALPGLLPGPPSFPPAPRAHPKSPDFAAWGIKNPNLKPIGSEVMLPRDKSPRLRGSGGSFWLSRFLGGRPEKSHHLSWSC